MMPKKTDTESRCTMDKKARKASEARHFRISGGILVVGLLLLLPVVNAAGNTNISILYGYNGTTYVPLFRDAVAVRRHDGSDDDTRRQRRHRDDGTGATFTRIISCYGGYDNGRIYECEWISITCTQESESDM